MMKNTKETGYQQNKLGGSRVFGPTSWRRYHLGIWEGGEVSCRKVGEGQPGGSSQHKHTEKETWGVL